VHARGTLGETEAAGNIPAAAVGGERRVDALPGQVPLLLLRPQQLSRRRLPRSTLRPSGDGGGSGDARQRGRAR
jgi:hypothetical protein